MSHAILTGEFELTIDSKNRLLIPSDIRKSLTPDRDGEGFYLVVGLNKKPWLYPERAYEILVSQAEQDILPDTDSLAFDQMYFAMATRVDVDGQGRILIPDKTLRRTGTGKEITMIAARNHLELWNREDWESQVQTYLSEMPELARRAKAARSKPAAPHDR